MRIFRANGLKIKETNIHSAVVGEENVFPYENNNAKSGKGRLWALFVRFKYKLLTRQFIASTQMQTGLVFVVVVRDRSSSFSRL